MSLVSPPLAFTSPSTALEPVEPEESPPPTPNPNDQAPSQQQQQQPQSAPLAMTASQSGLSLSLSAARMRAISPPTPAPSPQPFGNRTRFNSNEGAHASWTQECDDEVDEVAVIDSMRAQFALLSVSGRLQLLSTLLADSPPSTLSPLLPLITPRLKRDFLQTLPLELSFHVLSFVDDVRTLARASGVSKFWRALLEDEGTWKRMCWKSGFGDAKEGSAQRQQFGTRMRGLEFGERVEEEGTPAGRERRGTLDRVRLQELAANLAAQPQANATAAEASGWQSAGPIDTQGVAAQTWTNSTGLGLGAGFAPETTAASTSTIAQRRQRQGRAPPSQVSSSAAALALLTSPPRPLPFRQTHSDESGDAISPTNTTAPQTEIIRSPLPAPGSTASATSALADLPDATPRAGPSQLFRLGPFSATDGAGASSVPLKSPSYSNPIPNHQSQEFPFRKPFSYKTHFKRAYLTESAWLRGPGRLLSTQMSTDDGVVTSLGFDSEWIVVGMATSKVHVFEAGTGTYVKTLDGHELGVWCLTLVSTGGGPPPESDSNPNSPVYSTGAAAARVRAQAGAGFGSVPGRGPGDRSFADDSPNARSSFFRSQREDQSSSSAFGAGDSPPRPRRRRSFHAFGSGAAGEREQRADGPRTGGMGLGAGGETGDSSQQAGVCGTARGWGQKGAVVVSGGCDRDVRVWDLESGQCKHVLRGHTSTVRCMRVIDGRPIAVSGSRDATLRVWNIETGQALHLLAGHEHSVRCIEVSGNKVVSGSYDATCRLWDVDTGDCLHVFRGHQHQIYAVAFDGIRVVTGSLDSTVRIWSATTGEFLALLQGHTSLVGQLQLDPVSNVLVTGGSDGRVIVFSLSTFETIHRLCAHDNSVTCLQFDERFIVTGGNDGRIKLWDFKTGAFIRELAEPCEAVWRVTFRDDRCVTLCRRDGRTLMDVRTFRPADAELA